MSLHHTKLTLPSALLSFCLAGLFLVANFADSSIKCFAYATGLTHREPLRSGLHQTPDSIPGQSEQGSSGRKRKSFHEYGPEEVYSESEEQAGNPRQKKPQLPKPIAEKKMPLAPEPTVTPTPTPTPAQIAMPAAVMTPQVPQQVNKSNGFWVNKSNGFWWKLVISMVAFLSVLSTIIFFVGKLLWQIREYRQAEMDQTQQERNATAEHSTADERVRRPGETPKVLKNRMRYERT